MLTRLEEFGRARALATEAQAAGYAPLAAALEREIATGERRRRAQDFVDQAGAYFALGRREEGRALLEQATHVDSVNGRPWLMLADQRRLAGDLEGAAAALARGRRDPAPELKAEVALVGGMLDLTRGNRDAALAQFREAQRLNPRAGQAYLFEADALRGAGDVTGAIAALRRGLAELPGNRRMVAALTALGETP
jgi:tetratricopeptide (TPR) repeat protein